MNTKKTSNIIKFNLSIVFGVIILLAINSCKQKVKNQSQRKLVSKKTVSSVNDAQDIPEMRKDSISLFDLDYVVVSEGDTAAFVSVSDIDNLPGNDNSPSDSVDHLVIPSLENKTAKETSYLVLTSKYRKRLLKGTGISETDSLFFYDYEHDVLLRFAISSLDAIAKLSAYEDDTKAQHSAQDYMFGFKINRAALVGLNNRYFFNAYVYIGAKNPFLRGQMHPIIWGKTDPKNFPSMPLRTEEKEILKGYKLNGTYSFKSGENSFYLQDFSKPESDHCERILICDAKNKVISNELLSETESTSPAPLSFSNSNTTTYEQWTGRLLKNRTPLTLGFEYVSFGCPVLSFVDQSRGFVGLNCDNRH
jgi:hypothetical protein